MSHTRSLLSCAILCTCLLPACGGDFGAGMQTSALMNGGDWRDEVIYQLMVDRFADGDINNNHRVLYSALGRFQAEIKKMDCPAALPSPEHPPARMDVHYPAWLPGVVNRALWRRDARSWNEIFRAPLNEERAALGLPPVPGVQPYVFTNHPWLASDPVLGPAPHSCLDWWCAGCELQWIVHTRPASRPTPPSKSASKL